MSKNKTINLNRNNLNRCDIDLLKAMATYMYNSMNSTNKYDEIKYGKFDEIEKGNKPKIIKWLSQFDMKLGEE